jgi:hypothetical protein
MTTLQLSVACFERGCHFDAIYSGSLRHLSFRFALLRRIMEESLTAQSLPGTDFSMRGTFSCVSKITLFERLCLALRLLAAYLLKRILMAHSAKPVSCSSIPSNTRQGHMYPDFSCLLLSERQRQLSAQLSATEPDVWVARRIHFTLQHLSPGCSSADVSY